MLFEHHRGRRAGSRALRDGAILVDWEHAQGNAGRIRHSDRPGTVRSANIAAIRGASAWCRINAFGLRPEPRSMPHGRRGAGIFLPMVASRRVEQFLEGSTTGALQEYSWKRCRRWKSRRIWPCARPGLFQAERLRDQQQPAFHSAVLTAPSSARVRR
jgi:hypothetical protein